MKKYLKTPNRLTWVFYLVIICCVSFILNYLYSNKSQLNEGYTSCNLLTI